MATHSSVLAWRIPGTVKMGRRNGTDKPCRNAIKKPKG